MQKIEINDSWGRVQLREEKDHIGVLSEVQLFGDRWLLVEVPEVNDDPIVLEPPVARTQDTAMREFLFPVAEVIGIALLEEETARELIVKKWLDEQIMTVKEVDLDKLIEEAKEEEARGAPVFKTKYGGVPSTEPVADDDVGVLHGSDVCPKTLDHKHIWIRVQSAPRVDAEPDHPAEQLNLAVWLECAVCPAWAEETP